MLVGVLALIIYFSVHFAKKEKIELQGNTHLSFELRANPNEKLVIINETTHQNANLVLPTIYVPKGNRLVASYQPNYVVQMPFPTSAGQIYTFVPPASNFGASVKVVFEPKEIFTIPFYVRLFRDGGTVFFKSVLIDGTLFWLPGLSANSTSRVTNLVTQTPESLGGDFNPLDPYSWLSFLGGGMVENVGYQLLEPLLSIFGIEGNNQNQINYDEEVKVFELVQQLVKDVASDFNNLYQDNVNLLISNVNDGFNNTNNNINATLGYPQTANNLFYDYAQLSDPNALYSQTSPVLTYRQIINAGISGDGAAGGLAAAYANTRNLLGTYSNFSNFAGTNPSGQWIYYLQQLHNLVAAGQLLGQYDTQTFAEPDPKGFKPPFLSTNISAMQNDLKEYLPNGYDLWYTYLQTYLNNIVITNTSMQVQINDGYRYLNECPNNQYFAWCSAFIQCPPSLEEGNYAGFLAGITNPPVTCDVYQNCNVNLFHIVNNNDPLLQIPVASAGFPTNSNYLVLANDPQAVQTTPPNIIGSPDGQGGWTCQPSITQDQLAEARSYASDYLINYFGNPVQVLEIFAQIGGLSCTSYFSNSIYSYTSCVTLSAPSYQNAVRGFPFGPSRFSASSILDEVGVNLMESNLYSVSQNMTTKYYNETYQIAGFDGNLEQYYSSSIFEQFADWDNICCPVGTVNVSSAFFGSVSESVGGGNAPPNLGNRKLKCYGTTTSNNISQSVFLDTASTCKIIVPGTDLVTASGPVLVDRTFIGGNGYPALKYQTLNPQIDSALSAVNVGVGIFECLCGVGNKQGQPTPGCPGLYTNTTCYPNKMSLQFVIPSSWNAKPFPTIQNIYRSQFYMTDGYTEVPVNINYDGTNGCPSYGTNSSSPYIFSFTECYIQNPSYAQGLLGACVNLSATANKSTFTTGDTITIEDYEMIIEGTVFNGSLCPSDNFSIKGAESQSYYSAFASLQLPVSSWTLLYYPNII